MKCQQCQSEMVIDCDVKVDNALYGFKVSKKRKGLFNTTSAKPKAAVCSSCGYVAFYIEEYQVFAE